MKRAGSYKQREMGLELNRSAHTGGFYHSLSNGAKEHLDLQKLRKSREVGSFGQAFALQKHLFNNL